MRRRDFISAIGAFGLSPFSAFAQQPMKQHRVGILSADLPPPALLEDFESELRKLGYVQGQNMVWHLRNAEGVYERLVPLAEELVRLNVEVILAINTPAVQAAQKVTQKIPIVMTRVR